MESSRQGTRHCYRIDSDGCFVSLSISATASHNGSGMLSMNCRRCSMRHMSARCRTSVNKTGNSHVVSSTALRQLLAHFASKSSQSFSHSNSMKDNSLPIFRIGVPKIRLAPSCPHAQFSRRDQCQRFLSYPLMAFFSEGVLGVAAPCRSKGHLFPIPRFHDASSYNRCKPA